MEKSIGMWMFVDEYDERHHLIWGDRRILRRSMCVYGILHDGETEKVRVVPVRFSLESLFHSG